jgi:hypothetical protein
MSHEPLIRTFIYGTDNLIGVRDRRSHKHIDSHSTNRDLASNPCKELPAGRIVFRNKTVR